MTDTFSKQERSQIMRSVRSAGNKSTELKLIALFKQHGIKGWRRNFKLPGKPDFVFPRQRVVVFADGCFWHGHDCRNTKPAANAAYWQAKIERNRQRDQEVTAVLTAKKWRVVRIWECEIKRGEMQKFGDAGLQTSEVSKTSEV
jgi:DNA mismatch endonuclease, patch repair protein